MRDPVYVPKPTRGRVPARVVAVAALLGLALVITACASSWVHRQSGPFVAPPRLPAQARPAAAAPPPAPPPAAAQASAAADASVADLVVQVRVTDDRGTRVIALPLDEYVAGCVRAEVAPGADNSDAIGRFLQVQAVVSRTYAVAHLDRHRAEGFDLCDSTHCQLYRGVPRTATEPDSAIRAAAATRGQVITFEGRAIQAVFHSNCGGHTTASEYVWSGTPVPYLRPVPDWFCSREAAAKWEFVADEMQLRQAMNADSRTAIGRRLDRIDIVERDAAGRATIVGIAGAKTPVVKAEEFRSVMRQAFGPRSLQSTWFTVTRSANKFRFTGVGYGHGVGLCQAGAALRAKAGQSTAEVVAHYFPGTRIEPIAILASVLGRRVTALPDDQQ